MHLRTQDSPPVVPLCSHDSHRTRIARRVYLGSIVRRRGGWPEFLRSTDAQLDSQGCSFRRQSRRGQGWTSSDTIRSGTHIPSRQVETQRLTMGITGGSTHSTTRRGPRQVRRLPRHRTPSRHSPIPRRPFAFPQITPRSHDLTGRHRIGRERSSWGERTGGWESQATRISDGTGNGWGEEEGEGIAEDGEEEDGRDGEEYAD